MTLILFLLAGQDVRPWAEKPGPMPFRPEDSSWNVQLVGWIDSVGPEIGELVASGDGKVVYATVDSLGVVVIDISDPANPYIYKVIECDSLLWVGPMARVDTFLYVWWMGAGRKWKTYNISDPLEPLFLKDIYNDDGSGKPPPLWMKPGWVHDSLFYAIGGYKSFNINDPLNPTLISYITGGADQDFFLYPYIYTCGSYAVGDTFPFMIYDVSDPTNMFRVCEKWYWAPYGQAPRTLGAWELNGKRYVYMTGAGWSWSLDVTDPYNPVVLNFGDRDYTTYGSVTHGLRFYGLGIGCEFVVYSLEDPVYIPVVGWYNSDSLWFLERGVWANGYIVASGSWFAHYPSDGIAIYQYAGDQVKEEPKPSPSVLSFLRTIYLEPGLEFSLSQEAGISFSLYNAVGQRVSEKELGILGPGLHRIALPDLGTGVYFLELRIDKRVISKKLIFTQEGALYLPDENEPLPGPYLWGLAQKNWPGNESMRGPYGFTALHEKPQKEIHVLPLSFSCRQPAEITLYKPGGKEMFDLSPELTDSLFRLALFNHVLHQGCYSWIPGYDPVLYTGEGVYPPGYYRVFYLDPPVNVFPCAPDSIILLGKGTSDPEILYPWPIEDHSAPYAIRVHQANGIDFYARVVLLPDPERSELFARVRIHLWATEGITPYKGLAPGITRDFDLRIMRDGVIAGDGAR